MQEWIKFHDLKFLRREYTVVESFRRRVKAELEYVICVFGQRLIWALYCVLHFSVTVKSTSCYLGVWDVELQPDSHSVMWRSWSRAHKIHSSCFLESNTCAALAVLNWERLLNCNTIPQFELMYETDVEFELKEVEIKLKMKYININSLSRHF